MQGVDSRKSVPEREGRVLIFTLFLFLDAISRFHHANETMSGYKARDSYRDYLLLQISTSKICIIKENLNSTAMHVEMSSSSKTLLAVFQLLARRKLYSIQLLYKFNLLDENSKLEKSRCKLTNFARCKSLNLMSHMRKVETSDFN